MPPLAAAPLAIFSLTGLGLLCVVGIVLFASNQHQKVKQREAEIEKEKEKQRYAHQREKERLRYEHQQQLAQNEIKRERERLAHQQKLAEIEREREQRRLAHERKVKKLELQQFKYTKQLTLGYSITGIFTIATLLLFCFDNTTYTTTVPLLASIITAVWTGTTQAQMQEKQNLDFGEVMNLMRCFITASK